MNGRRQALSYGFMESVRLSIVGPPTLLMICAFVAGAGKSTLWCVTPQPTFVDIVYISVTSSSIIKDLESMRASGLASVAYYYFDFRDTRKQDLRGLLSSLLVQLCTRSDHGYDILSSLYRTHQNGSRQPGEVDLIRCLKDVLAVPGHGKAYIILDAMDESPNPGIPSPREGALQLIEELVDLRHPDLRVCITSRPEVDIQTVLKPLASHAVSLHDEGGQRRDINAYIESVVKSDANMRKWRPEDRQLVINSLSQKANGM